MDKNDNEADLARNDAKKFRRWSRFWECNLVFAIVYPFLPDSAEPWMLSYLAAVSIWALKLGEDSKAEAAEAKAASYDNP